MDLLVVGATGAVGRQLVPRLVQRGHAVVGTTTSPAGRRVVEQAGATPAVLDALDGAAVRELVRRVGPEVVVHQATALRGGLDLRRFDRSFATTNRLRTEGVDHLLAAGREAGVRRVVVQSFAGWPAGRTGDAVATELDPLDDDPLPRMRSTLEALRHLESAVLGARWTEGIVLRYGGLCGPGTSLDTGGEHVRAIRRRRFPVVGDGGGVWSFTDTRDAAAATVAAAEHGTRGIYAVVDDEPATVATWLPAMARALGAPPPRHVPRRLGRLLAGDVATAMMTDVRGASNAKARAELGWSPRYSWRDVRG